MKALAFARQHGVGIFQCGVWLPAVYLRRKGLRRRHQRIHHLG